MHLRISGWVAVCKFGRNSRMAAESMQSVERRKREGMEGKKGMRPLTNPCEGAGKVWHPGESRYSLGGWSIE